MPLIIFIISLLIITGFFFLFFKRKKLIPQLQPEKVKELLGGYISFYQKLNEDEKPRFEEGVKAFLLSVRITGIKTTVEDIDRIFVASAATIPIFSFEGWKYRNLNEVILYPGSFSKEYQLEGEGRSVSGMVGEGPLQNVMLLSQQELRSGFLSPANGYNTGIHEFVHLVDKSDGSTDGIPELLLPHNYAVPFLKRIHAEVKKIQSGKSDINPYGATNEAEFLAVAAEYFFGKPEEMQAKHPELYSMLREVFIGKTPTEQN